MEPLVPRCRRPEQTGEGSGCACAHRSGRRGFRLEVLDDRRTEFPRVDDRRQGLPTRYAVFSHRSSAALAMGSLDGLFRFDLTRGTIEVHSFSGWAIGEAVFAPKAGRTDEAAGYILTFATNIATMESTFVILDAEDFAGEPAAVVELPRRVPLGLHGNWYPADRVSPSPLICRQPLPAS
jgi:carotenoid cleavage dioxygenase-like enzyme